MVKRKIWMILVIMILFSGFVFSKKVKATASCQCNGDWCETNFGDLGVNGGDFPEAISVNNCPATANIFRKTDKSSMQSNNAVVPVCKKNTADLWVCSCQADYYAFDITIGDEYYYAEYVDKATGEDVSTEKTDPLTCSNGGNCCICSGYDNVSTDYCNSNMKANCSDRLSWSGTSTNCSCGEKPVAGADLNNYDPFTGCSATSINTAFGCVPTETNSFVSWLLGWLFGVAGGIAFLLMVYGFILVATSGGDEKKVAGAKETITSAIIGLLVCIFSIFILRLITVNILQIPGI